MEIVLASEGLPIVASPSGPPRDCFLHKLKRCKGGSGSRPRWKSEDGSAFFEWDARHLNVEAYNRTGRHIGVFDKDGNQLEMGKKGRNINVK